MVHNDNASGSCCLRVLNLELERTGSATDERDIPWRKACKVFLFASTRRYL
jgi:hypothetical protein